MCQCDGPHNRWFSFGSEQEVKTNYVPLMRFLIKNKIYGKFDFETNGYICLNKQFSDYFSNCENKLIFEFDKIILKTGICINV